MKGNAEKQYESFHSNVQIIHNLMQSMRSLFNVKPSPYLSLRVKTVRQYLGCGETPRTSCPRGTSWSTAQRCRTCAAMRNVKSTGYVYVLEW